MAWTKEQEMAIYTKGSNIIVSAGAGSGKTAVLSTRVIETILTGTHVDELLILTFTNAAAGEMKERIKKKIKENNLEEEVIRLDNAYITTFDSFALSIVKKYHYLLNIKKEVEITDESILTLQKKKILEEIFEKHYEKEEENFLKLIKDFCLKEDNQLKTEILSLANTLEIRTDKEEYLNTYIEKNYTEEIYEKLVKKYQEILKESIEELLNELEIQKNYFESDYEQKLKNAITPLKYIDDLNELIAKIEITKLPAAPRGSEEETKEAKKKISDLLKKIKEEKTCFGYQEEITNDYKATKNYMLIIVDILKEFFEKLENWKKENNAYDFTDIAHLSLKLLKENQNIRKDLKYFFKEIMVDEYQDTSDTQEEFISLIENNNVYMVGDIKQSIYRFRNANPYIFKNKYDNYSKKINGIKIDLLKNFRSRKEVLDDINTIFNPIMTNKIGNAEYIESHQMVFGNTLYETSGKTNQPYNMDILEYEITSKEYSKEEIEIFAIAKDIQEKIKNKYLIFDKDKQELHEANYQDFCIIMDRNSTFDLTKKIFEYFKIPLCMYKDEVLTESIDIAILKNLIELLLCIKDKKYDKTFSYAFMSIARSFLYRLNDEEIFDFLEKRNFWDSKILKDLQDIIPKINSSSPSEIIEEILEKTNYYELSITTGNIEEKKARIEKIINLSESLKSLNFDIYKFQEYLNNLLTQKQIIKMNLGIDSSNAVKIMNIHKSKGLEFNICYFCGLYKSFSKEDIKGNIVYEKTLPIYMPNNEIGSKENIIKLLIKDKINHDDISEKIRLFYVGLTRAKEKMILLLPKKEDVKEIKDENGNITESIRLQYKSIADMLYSIPNTLKRYTKELNIKSLNLTKEYQLQNNVEDNLKEDTKKIIVKELEIENKKEITHNTYSKKIDSIISKETKRNIELGIKVHHLLEYFDLKNKNYEEIEDEFIKELIKEMLNDELFKNIEKANIYQEYEFIYEEDQKEYHGIIDLMLEYETHIDVIDYKLNNITDENYLKQLDGYKKFIEKKSNKKVHTYLYSILDKTSKKIA